MRAALLLLALSHLSMGFAAPPNVVQIDFVVTSGPAHIGEGSDILEHDGQHYSIVSESRTAGIAKLFSNTSIRRQSRGQLLDSGMRPETFEEIRTRDRFLHGNESRSVDPALSQHLQNDRGGKARRPLHGREPRFGVFIFEEVV